MGAGANGEGRGERGDGEGNVNRRNEGATTDFSDDTDEKGGKGGMKELQLHNENPRGPDHGWRKDGEEGNRRRRLTEGN